MNTRWLAIKQLDRQLKAWQEANHQYSRPKLGWIKTLRSALNMSAAQLADRLGLSRSRITQLENAEVHDAVTLRTLRETANALGCDLVYAIVPKNNSTLESFIKTTAEQVAKERVARVAHTMSLEAQDVDLGLLKQMEEELTKNLIWHLNKKFWKSLELEKLEDPLEKKLHS